MQWLTHASHRDWLSFFLGALAGLICVFAVHWYSKRRKL